MSTTDNEREALRTAIGGVLFNVSNFPENVQHRLLGQDMCRLNAKLSEAILAAGFHRQGPIDGNGSCWDEGPQILAAGECAPMPPRCELKAAHAGAHRDGDAEWMHGRQGPVTDADEIGKLPVGTILRDEIGRVFIRTDANIFRWRTIWGRGFDLTNAQVASYPVRVLFIPDAS